MQFISGKQEKRREKTQKSIPLKIHLKAANESPAGLVESGRHEGRVHGQGPDVEASHAGHHTIPGLATT
jgi:hypothetical protein